MVARRLRLLLFLLFTSRGHRYLPGWLFRPRRWLWRASLVLLASALFSSSSHLSASEFLPSLLLFLSVLVVSWIVASSSRRRVVPQLHRLYFPVLLLLCFLPLLLLFTYIGILTEPYFFNSKRMNRTLRGTNHVPFRPLRGIRTDPVPAGLLLGSAILMVSSKLVRSRPLPGQDRYVPDNWDTGHWENVEVLGDEHSDAAVEFYLDRASSAIRLTFTTPVLDYYLERLIQFDEGIHWWFPDRPPPFYSEKPFRSHCWGGVPRYVPRDLYFVDPTGPAPQYHPRGGYHPLWVNRQAALMLGKQPLPDVRYGFRSPLWLSPLSDGVRPVQRVPLPTGVQRQQRLLARLERHEELRERVEKLLSGFRSRETSMTTMQRYLYHPDAQEERDHRHMRIRQHLEEQEELDRLADVALEENDWHNEYNHWLIYEDWEEELEQFDDELVEDFNIIPLLDRKPRPYSLFEVRAFVPYPTAPNHGA